MVIGRLTEQGIQIETAPIIMEEQDSLLMSFFKKSNKNENLNELMRLAKKLKSLDSIKNKKQSQLKNLEKEETVKSLKSLLEKSD